MTLSINDHRRIADLQADFQADFPFLKLEFFGRPHQVGEPSKANDKLDSDKQLSDIRWIHQDTLITLEETTRVTELEAAFQEMCALSVQVFRRSGELWLETTVTDHWTLAEQNAEGMASVARV